MPRLDVVEVSEAEMRPLAAPRAAGNVRSLHAVLVHSGPPNALRMLGDIVARTADVRAAIRHVNRDVGPVLGLKLLACTIATPSLRAATGLPRPGDEEATAIARWRSDMGRGATPAPRRARSGRGLVLVPVVHQHRIHGALRVAITDREAASPDALAAVGVACGEVAWKAGMVRELARRRRQLAVATEQEEAVGRVQESVRLMLAEIGQHLATCLVDAPDTAWRHRFEDLLYMTGQASGQVRHAQAIAQSLPMQGDDLDSSLRALIRAVATDTGLAVKLRIEGEGRALTFARRDALFQVAIAALFTAGQQARASYAVVALTYGKGEVRLAVRDDGVDPARRDLFSNRAMGVRGAQQRVHAVGGQLRVRGLQPRGASVEATVPTRRGPGGGPRQ